MDVPLMVLKNSTKKCCTEKEGWDICPCPSSQLQEVNLTQYDSALLYGKREEYLNDRVSKREKKCFRKRKAEEEEGGYSTKREGRRCCIDTLFTARGSPSFLNECKDLLGGINEQRYCNSSPRTNVGKLRNENLPTVYSKS